jgi:hypothetical protein
LEFTHGFPNNALFARFMPVIIVRHGTGQKVLQKVAQRLPISPSLGGLNVESCRLQVLQNAGSAGFTEG